MKKKILIAVISIACFCLVVILLLIKPFNQVPSSLEAMPYEWKSGSVFKEYSYYGPTVAEQSDTLKWPIKCEEVDPYSTFEFKENPDDMSKRRARARMPRYLNIEKADAIVAEILMEMTGCHIATPVWFTYNEDLPQGIHPREESKWIPIPRCIGTPTEPELYHHTILGSLAVPLDVDKLREGQNNFQFTVGPQMKFSWGFGCIWVYDFHVRTYYPRESIHPSGTIANISSGEELSGNPEIEVSVTPGAAPIKCVDIFAYYEGFNVSGSGYNQEWHGQLNYGTPKFHVGSATEPPYRVTWNTEWIPDQDKPMRLVARIVDEDGWNAVTPIVENLRLKRIGRHVEMFQAVDIPERFSVRNGDTTQCGIKVNLKGKKPVRAMMAIRTSFGGEMITWIKLNDTIIASGIGRGNRYGTDFIDIPVDLVQQGYNVFKVMGGTSPHGPEYDWPGPALFVEFQ